MSSIRHPYIPVFLCYILVLLLCDNSYGRIGGSIVFVLLCYSFYHLISKSPENVVHEPDFNTSHMIYTNHFIPHLRYYGA